MAPPPDPFATLSRNQRWRMRRALRRAWRRGIQDRDRTTVAALQERCAVMPLSHVRVDRVGPLRVTEVGFLDGCRLRLGFCHQATVARLIEATSTGFVTLQRVCRHGDFWGLYFDTPAGVLPVLANEARLGIDQGGHGPDAGAWVDHPTGGLALSTI